MVKPLMNSQFEKLDRMWRLYNGVVTPVETEFSLKEVEKNRRDNQEVQQGRKRITSKDYQTLQ